MPEGRSPKMSSPASADSPFSSVDAQEWAKRVPAGRVRMLDRFAHRCNARDRVVHAAAPMPAPISARLDAFMVDRKHAPRARRRWAGLTTVEPRDPQCGAQRPARARRTVAVHARSGRRTGPVAQHGAAYELLGAEGLLISRRGSGWYVVAVRQDPAEASLPARAPPPSRYAQRVREAGPFVVGAATRRLRLNLQYGEPLPDPLLPDLWRRELTRAAAYTSLGCARSQGCRSCAPKSAHTGVFSRIQRSGSAARFVMPDPPRTAATIE